MNTIKSGKIFCDVYNKNHRTSLTPKEIFCDVIAPLLFFGKKHLIYWINSKFSHSKGIWVKTCKNWDQTKIDEYRNIFIEETLKPFCEGIETDEYNVMTTSNIFCGCANPEYGATTMFSYSDNLYFSIDERYCSFIGSAFSYLCEGWNIVINNEELIWSTYEGLRKYREILDSNSNLKGNQLQAWNSAYLSTVVNGDKVSYIVSEFFKKTKDDKHIFELDITDKINFMNFLFFVQKFTKGNVKQIELYIPGQTNVTCGAIQINVDYVSRQSRLFEQLYTAMHEDFRYADFNKLCGSSKNNLIYRAIEIGAVYPGFFNPSGYIVNDIKENKKGKKTIKINNYYKTYLDIIMKEDIKTLAKDFAKQLKEIKDKSRTNVHEKDVFRAPNTRQIFQRLVELGPNDVFTAVVDHIASIPTQDAKDFLAYSEYHFYEISNK